MLHVLPVTLGNSEKVLAFLVGIQPVKAWFGYVPPILRNLFPRPDVVSGRDNALHRDQLALIGRGFSGRMVLAGGSAKAAGTTPINAKNKTTILSIIVPVTRVPTRTMKGHLSRFNGPRQPAACDLLRAVPATEPR